ncbi:MULTISPECIES: redoxin domain-containing protein [unclassified Campylobacter]|uniref:redoxin domain-containing protein n=1 Tax=unclassified Campylobacter TaxID=2593542 RepID=UPI003D34F3D9
MRDLQGKKVDFNALIAGKNSIVLLLPKIGASAKFLPAEYENFAGLTGCSNQCMAYQSELANFCQKGYEIYAISSLDVMAMAEFKASIGVDFEFYSDAEFELENLLALKTLKSGDGKKFYHRQTLIFKNGKLAKRLEFIAKPNEDANSVLNMIS